MLFRGGVYGLGSLMLGVFRFVLCVGLLSGS